MSINLEFLNWPAYDFRKKVKEKYLYEKLKELTIYHQKNCWEYKSILKNRDFDFDCKNSLSSLPWIPVRLFKHYDFTSINKDNIYKILFSSGTTGNSPSKIILDKNTSQVQSKVLVKILQNFIGKKRLPMLIVDCANIIKNKTSFSARGAGILGLSNFGHSHTFALKDDMTLDINKIKEFSEKYINQPKLIFGFTFMLWKYFIKQIERSGETLNLSKSILFHSGGWKKMQSEAVDNKLFKEKIKELTSIQRIHNFYGMVEQVGSIFVECEKGHLHASSYSDVIIRDPINFNSLPKREKGLVQVLSSLPHSYPGHSLLTEDIGEILGEDDCECGRNGKYFKIYGRILNSENRGCSDTFYNV